MAMSTSSPVHVLLRVRLGSAALVVAILVLAAAPAVASDFYGRCHYPMAHGNWWDYRATAQGQVITASCSILPFKGNVNGVSTWIVHCEGGDAVGSDEHFTNDEQGIRLHRTEVDFFGASVTFVPPLVVAPADARVGEVVRSEGTLVLDASGIPPIELPYTGSSRVAAREVIQLPAGTFETIRVPLEFSASGTVEIQGQTLSISINETDQVWYALDVGLVRSQLTAQGSVNGQFSSESLTLELLDYHLAGPCDDFDYQAYLAANPDLLPEGVCDETSARQHWLEVGRSEGRPFDPGQLRSDLPGGVIDPDYAISGGFTWQYTDGRSVVFITQDAPKPPGWAGADLLLARCQTFGLGPTYEADAYRTWNTDVATVIDARSVPEFASVSDHYVKYGFKEGRIATDDWTLVELESWDDALYCAANPDVCSFFEQASLDGWGQAPLPGFAHWVNFGQYEERDDGQVLFLAYLAANPDLLSAAVCDEDDARWHWRAFGQAGGRVFDPGHLRSDQPDEALDPRYAISGGFAWEYEDGTSAVFVTADAPLPSGWAGCDPLLARCQTFGLGDYDAEDYLARNPDLAQIAAGEALEFVSVTDHFAKYGFKEGRLANQQGWDDADHEAWSDAGYFAVNPDVKDFFDAAVSCGWGQASKPGFGHWINFGRSEGRSSGQ